MTERRHALPDGRELAAVDEGEPVGWVVRVVGEGRVARGREIHDVLVELLAPGPGSWPPWFVAAAAELAACDTPLGRRYACPCCRHLTLEEAPAGTYAICPVCFWEDDGVQYRDPDYEGGANRVSLREARANVRAHGVSEPRFAKYVRPPLDAERP